MQQGCSRSIMYGASMATAPNAQEKTNQQAKILAMTGHRWVAAALLPNCLMPNQKQYSKTSTSTPQSSNSGADKTGKRKLHITTMEVTMHTA